MNRNHLAAFHAVAETGSFSRGAERLLVTQPAVSLHVADLEGSLGVKLFDRLPRGVRMTDAGTLLLGFARRIAAAEIEAEHAFAELRGMKRGRLVIGASLTVGEYLLPRMLGEFRRRHPGVSLELEIVNTQLVQQRLVEGHLDLGMTEGLADHDDALTAEIFRHDELVAIAQRKHPLLAKPSVTIRTLCREPVILREQGSGTRAVVERALANKGLKIEPVMSLGSTEAVKQAVIAGIGVAIVSRLAMNDDDKRLAIVPLSDLLMRRPLYLLQSKHRTPSRATGEFLHLLRASR